MGKRDLTTLEYIVLGLVSLQPQSGYSIVSYFEDGSYSWSASPGSIYPILKRLEQSGLLNGELEMEHETRPRRMYTLTEEGGGVLDEWLREVPKMRPFYQEREIALMKFQFMERRLSRQAILTWLDGYLDAIKYADYGSKVYRDGIEAAIEVSVHGQLLMEAYLMEMNTLRTWLELARGRIGLLVRQTGEWHRLGDDGN